MTLNMSLRTKGEAAWAKATDREREAALKHATEFIDTLPFKGRRATETQSLSWPRVGVTRNDGAPVLGVPHEVKVVTFMVAGFILAKVPFSAEALAHVFLELDALLEDEGPTGHSGWH